MAELDLVFDFDGWKLNGVYIFSQPSAFAFLGPEDTPPTETLIEPGFLEKLKAGLTGQTLAPKRQVHDDDALIYEKLGLCLEFESCVYEFKIFVQDDQDLDFKRFPGRFVFGAETLDLSAKTSIQNVKDLFGTPDEEDTDSDYIEYNIGQYELIFWFDESHNLHQIYGALNTSDEANS